jgi:Bacterial membrane protein YfhO
LRNQLRIDVADPTTDAEVVSPEPAPSRPRIRGADIVGAIACCAIVLIAFAPVIFGGRTLSAAGKGAAGVTGTAPFPGQPPADYSPDFRPDQGASTWQFEPWARVNERTYSEGELPFWNPYQGSGTPQAANMQSAPFDPLLLAVNLHPTQRVWDFSIVAAFVLGALATFVFARVLGLFPVPAVVASAAFSLSGYFFLNSNNQFSRSYAYLPIVLTLVEVTLRSRRSWPVFALGIAVAGNLVVGMPEASLFVLGAAAVYGVVRIIEQRHEVAPSVAIARVGGGFLLGVVVASPLLLSFREYEALSSNAHKGSSGQGSQADPTWGLLNLVAPFFHGVKKAFTSPGVRDWCGGAVLVAALVGVSGRRVTRQAHAWLFLAGSVLLLVKIYDLHVLEWVGRLPILRQANFPLFATPVAMFGVAMLAGIGIQVIWTRDLVVRRFLAALGVAAVVLAAIMLTGDSWHLITLPTGSDIFRAWGIAAAGALIVIVGAVIARYLDARAAACIAALAVVVELFVLAPFSIYAERSDPYVKPAWYSYVQTALKGDPHARVFGLDAKLFPNTAAGLGLQDITMLDALYVERYWRFIKSFVQPSVVTRFNGGPYASEETRVARYRSNPMFDLLGVRAFVTQQELETASPGIPSTPGHVALRLVGQTDDTKVYENVAAYPRAWVVHRVARVDDEDAAFRYLRQRVRPQRDVSTSPAFDPLTEAVVESSGSLRAARGACTGASDNVDVTGYTSNSVSMRVDAECAGLLVLPDTYFPGWSATVNGKDRQVLATDGAFRGVLVPRGASTVEFHYEPSQFPLGVGLAVSGIAVFGIVVIVTVVRRRRGTTDVATRPPSGRRDSDE